MHLEIHESIDEDLFKYTALKSVCLDTFAESFRPSPVIKMIWIKKIEMKDETNETSLEALLACRLIPLDQNLDLRSTRVGEVYMKSGDTNS